MINNKRNNANIKIFKLHSFCKLKDFVLNVLCDDLRDIIICYQNYIYILL